MFHPSRLRLVCEFKYRSLRETPRGSVTGGDMAMAHSPTYPASKHDIRCSAFSYL